MKLAQHRRGIIGIGIGGDSSSILLIRTFLRDFVVPLAPQIFDRIPKLSKHNKHTSVVGRKSFHKTTTTYSTMSTAEEVSVLPPPSSIYAQLEL